MYATPPTVFKPIPLEPYRCLDNGLEMCILFGYSPQISFVTFCHFRKLNLVIFPIKVNKYQLYCVRNSSYIYSSMPIVLNKSCFFHKLSLVAFMRLILSK